MSGVLDACTSYGTHLFWPIYQERIAWHIISIIDPVFSLILLVTLIVAIKRPGRRVVYTGIGFAFVYLMLGALQFNRAQQEVNHLTQERGHVVTQSVVKPTLGNLLLWRSVYIHEQRIYVDAIRLGILNKSEIFHGGSIQRLDIAKDYPDLEAESVLYKDIQRFIKFSDGYVAVHPDKENVLGDIRYSMLPTKVVPLWGISVDIDNPQQHADYLFFRNNSQEIRQQFFDMLTGS